MILFSKAKLINLKTFSYKNFFENANRIKIQKDDIPKLSIAEKLFQDQLEVVVKSKKYIESLKFTNKTPHFWQMAARFEFEEDHSQVFSGPENFDVAPGDTFFYPVQFLSSHQGEYFTSLIVNNLSDGTKNVFNITGYALEPKISKIISLFLFLCPIKLINLINV